NRWLRKDSAILPWLSSMGEISSKISPKPWSMSHSNDSRWIATRSSSSMGSASRIFAKLRRELTAVPANRDLPGVVVGASGENGTRTNGAVRETHEDRGYGRGAGPAVR